jgi:hypothetical protein
MNMEAIDKFLNRYEQHKWLYILTSPVLLLVGFVLLMLVLALAGALILVIEGFYEYWDEIKAYPKRYLAVWRGDQGENA